MTPDPRSLIPEPRLLIVRPSALGDVARTVPAAVSLKRAFPDATLDWVVNRPFADAVRAHPAVDEVIPFDRDQPGKVWALMRELRRRRYDAVYDLQGLARSGLLTWATRAKRRVGFKDAREGAWLGYNTKHRIDPGLHTVDRMMALLQADRVEPVDDLALRPSRAGLHRGRQRLLQPTGTAPGRVPRDPRGHCAPRGVC